MLHDDRSEEVISVWVRRLLEHMRILNSKRFPSDLSLASNSSSTSAWSGLSGHSNRTHQPAASGHVGLLGHHNSGHTLAGHATLGGGAFQFMEPSWGLCVLMTLRRPSIFILVDISNSVWLHVCKCLAVDSNSFYSFCVYFYGTVLLIDSLLVYTIVSNSLWIFLSKQLKVK